MSLTVVFALLEKFGYSAGYFGREVRISRFQIVWNPKFGFEKKKSISEDLQKFTNSLSKQSVLSPINQGGHVRRMAC